MGDAYDQLAVCAADSRRHGGRQSGQHWQPRVRCGTCGTAPWARARSVYGRTEKGHGLPAVRTGDGGG
ncbi:hypothetical protein TSO5_27675 [Azospirillum sp. TSO5]|nr:hypothetical protein TSO5_27675 [Azospirillum sp. TSO5]